MQIEFEQSQDQTELKMIERLDAFAKSLCRKRKEAVDARKQSGIEQQWDEDLDYYNGIDDANRVSETYIKPSNMDGVLTSSGNNTEASSKSNLFINITQMYCDGAASRVMDMLTPIGQDKQFSFKPTPIETTEAALKLTVSGADFLQVITFIQNHHQQTLDAAKKAENYVQDWLVECKWMSELRKAIDDIAQVGYAVVKGPVPYKSVSRKAKRTEYGVEMVQIEEYKPGSRRINFKNFYPDPACGENIHNGSYTWEKDDITTKQLMDLMGGDYLDSQVSLILKEGPNKKYITNQSEAKESDSFEIWYFNGLADAEDLKSCGMDCEDGDKIPVMITMVNDRVIKASMHALDSESFPYDVFTWQNIEGSIYGKGMARIIRACQRKLNAAVRNMMDNAGISAGGQIIIRDRVIQPMDGSWQLSPMKLWVVDNNADIQDVRNAITSVLIPSAQQDLSAIIQMALDFAERISSFPLLMQGQQGNATDTAQGMNLLKNNSNTVLRRIAMMFDDRITPHLDRYYEWLMMYGEDESSKGDFKIESLGSVSLYEQDVENQFIGGLGGLVVNPAFELSPARWAEELLRINKIDPKRLKLTDKEKAEMAQRAQQQPPDPRIQVAKMQSDMEMQKTQMQMQADQQSDAQEMKFKEQVTTAEIKTKMDEADLQRQHDKEMLQMQYSMEMMKLSRESGLTFEQIKAGLAETAMKLRTQKELSIASLSTDLHKQITPQAITPPTEPVGRAQDGMAWQQ